MRGVLRMLGISIGGHLGGLLVGLAFGYTFERWLAGADRSATRSAGFREG